MGPLAQMSSLNVMWVSFYSIASMMISMGLIYFVRSKVKNAFFSSIIKLIAYVLFGIGSFLMVLVVATWPA